MTEEMERDRFDIVRLVIGDGFVFAVSKNGELLPGVFWDEEQASVAIEFDTTYIESRTFGRTFVAIPARGLPPGYLLFVLYDGDVIVGIVIWGPRGIFPDVFLDLAEAVAAAQRQYDEYRAPKSGYDW